MIGFVYVVSQSDLSDNFLWHLCLDHMSEKCLDILTKQDLHGHHKVEHLQFCEHCVYGKQHWTKFPKAAQTIKVAF